MINMQKRVWEQDARNELKFEIALKYIEKGKTTIEEASIDLDIPATEIEEAIKKAGIKVPEFV